MTAALEGNREAAAAGGGDGLVAWAARSGLPESRGPVRGGLRFVFYGRVSTEDWQDPVTSRARQHEQAAALVRGHGVVVAEFFDVGQSRTVAWGRRPEAAALVAQLADPGRGWDAIVIGEYERAFYGSQYAAMAPLFEHYGVQLWMPEAGGLVDYASEHDEQAMTVLGLSSKRRDHPDQHPGPHRDGRPDPAGPVPGRPPALRVPACRCKAAPEQGARRPGAAGAPPGARPGNRARRVVDLRPSGWRGIPWRGSPGR